MPWLAAYVTIAWGIRLAMVPVILRRQFAPGASLAWLGIIFLHPYIGLTLYLLIGEARLAPHRMALRQQMANRFRPGRRGADALDRPARLALAEAYEPMVRQAERISGMPVLGGNHVEFIEPVDALVERLARDIATARSDVRLLYYTLAPDATGRIVVDALRGAAERGVRCRVLADAVASRPLFRSGWVEELRRAGVEIAPALALAPLRRGLSRMDLRNHRKLAVIDNRVAYAGSHNLIDANYGGRQGAPWVDVTGRFTGPVVDEMAVVFAEDWAFETGEQLETAQRDWPGGDGTAMQVVPTGPGEPGDTYRRVLLAAVQSARRELTLTTPYFVPDEPTLVSLLMAADRGVDVKLLVPQTPDHVFTAAAGRAHFSALLLAGVSIHLFRPGLLHTKSTTVDDAFAIVGSANLDVRSFNLNFELSVLLYGAEVTREMRAIQERYLAASERLSTDAWMERGAVSRYADRAIALLSPLL